MRSLTEIEAAADALSIAEQQELLLYIATRLRVQGAPMPEPRTFTTEQIEGWIAKDEADMRDFRNGSPT